MSSGFLFTITSAGLDALVDAQNGNTNAIVITQLGISASEVDIAPTLLALPNEIKRIDTLSGESVSETIIHMTAFDASTDVYEVRSLGLYLADGTLFAAYSREVGPRSISRPSCSRSMSPLLTRSRNRSSSAMRPSSIHPRPRAPRALPSWRPRRKPTPKKTTSGSSPR